MSKHELRYQICVSGAARGDSVEPAKELAAAVAREIVRRGHLVVTGAPDEERRRTFIMRATELLARERQQVGAVLGLGHVGGDGLHAGG